MTYDDFCRLEFEEFAAVWKAYAERRNFLYKDEWERMRLLASITIQPHLAKGRRLTPDKLLPFPWDNKQKTRADAPKLSVQERRKRMKALAEKLGDKI